MDLLALEVGLRDGFVLQILSPNPRPNFWIHHWAGIILIISVRKYVSCSNTEKNRTHKNMLILWKWLYVSGQIVLNKFMAIVTARVYWLGYVSLVSMLLPMSVCLCPSVRATKFWMSWYFNFILVTQMDFLAVHFGIQLNFYQIIMKYTYFS